MTSKQIADIWGPSVYDIALESNPNIHMLEDSIHEDQMLVLKNVVVHDICTPHVCVMRAFEQPERIISVLKKTTYAGFPIVDEQQRMVGFVTRARLVAVLSKRADHEALSTAKMPIMRISE